MHALEPPPYLWWKDPLLNQFNWTMTYRTDSDIWIPYGKIVPRKIPVENISIQNISLKSWINKKNKLAAGVISRCQTDSKRENIVEHLNKSMNIDVYGKCGRMPSCGGVFSKKCSSFWTDLSRKYKFYLAFENSICKDYITEKFWRSLELGMVPVVYGGENYLKEAPPGSYINVRDFRNVSQLAGFLKTIGENKTEYGKYFEWRKRYRILNKDESIRKDWCGLCKAVRNHIKFGGYSKIYNNSKLWWQSMSKGNYSKLACLKSHKFFKSQT